MDFEKYPEKKKPKIEKLHLNFFLASAICNIVHLIYFIIIICCSHLSKNNQQTTRTISKSLATSTAASTLQKEREKEEENGRRRLLIWMTLEFVCSLWIEADKAHTEQSTVTRKKEGKCAQNW